MLYQDLTTKIITWITFRLYIIHIIDLFNVVLVLLRIIVKSEDEGYKEISIFKFLIFFNAVVFLLFAIVALLESNDDINLPLAFVSIV